MTLTDALHLYYAVSRQAQSTKARVAPPVRVLHGPNGPRQFTLVLIQDGRINRSHESRVAA